LVNPTILNELARSLLSGEHLRLTPLELIRLLRLNLPGVDSALAKQVIRQMVEAKELLYTNHFSISHLELNRLGVTQVSDRISLRSATAPSFSKSRQIEILLSSGAAFGRGDHPTTRLALRSLDRIVHSLLREQGRKNDRSYTALDVGTGSGVLAMAAVMLGMCRAIGLDTDPVACYEAQGNLRINELHGRLAIVAGSLDVVKRGKFDLVLANLRPPTLCALMPQLKDISSPSSFWVLSGFRPCETSALVACLPDDFSVLWNETEQDWAVLGVGRAGGV
jgi:ribosomal protein L11 methyltransferase